MSEYTVQFLIAMTFLFPLSVVAGEWKQGDKPPDGYFLVARDNCGAPGEQPHLVYGVSERIPESKVPLSEAAADDPLRTLSRGENGGDSVIYQYEFLRQDARYKVRVAYFSRWRYQSLSANGRLLHTQIDIPAYQPVRLEFDLEPDVLGNGRLELQIGNVAGWAPAVNLIELWSDKPFLNVTTSWDDSNSVRGRVTDFSGKPATAASVAISSGAVEAAIRLVTDTKGEFLLSDLPEEWNAKRIHSAIVTVTHGDAVGLARVQVPARNLYEILAKGPWRRVPWCGYDFVFQPYGNHKWNEKCPVAQWRRAAAESEYYQLLTPTWNDPDYWNTHIMPGLGEWAYVRWTPGRTKRECYENMRRWYLGERRKRIENVKKRLPGKTIPFSSMSGHGWRFHEPAEWGCDLLALEIGENIIRTQAKLAFLRGAARMNGLPTAVDCSQWYGGTVPKFSSGQDEFTPLVHDMKNIKEMISKGGGAIPNGGHSSSLLARMWRLCWLSGATIVLPEACQSNFFASPDGEQPDHRIPLSPIGKRAQKLYALTQKHPDIGISYTPFAILLDQYSGFNAFPLYHTLKPWNSLPISDGDRQIHRFLEALYPGSVSPSKTAKPESRFIVQTPFGNTFDVLVTNVKKELLCLYPVVICLGEHEFIPETVATLRDYLLTGGRLITTSKQADQLGKNFDDLRQLGWIELFDDSRGAQSVEKLLQFLAEEYLPVEVEGKVGYTINRTKDGWVVGIFNNDGISKTPTSHVTVDKSKTQTVTVKLKRGAIKSADEWCTDRPLEAERNGVAVEAPPGEVRIVAIVESDKE